MANSVWIWPGILTNNGATINPQLPIAFPDGTGGAPSIAFANETGLGWYRSATGQMAFVDDQYSTTVPMAVFRSSALVFGSVVSFSWSTTGDATAASDATIRRSATKTITLDTDGAGGALTLVAVKGPLTASGNASATVAPASPTGTTSTTLVMAGLAGSITTQTGKIILTMSGYLTDNTANDGTKCQMSYGTGTAPVNGAALTGTQVGPVVQFNASTLAAGASAPYAATWIVTGLTVNTAYWFDTAFAAITGGTGAIVQAAMTACDIP